MRKCVRAYNIQNIPLRPSKPSARPPPPFTHLSIAFFLWLLLFLFGSVMFAYQFTPSISIIYMRACARLVPIHIILNTVFEMLCACGFETESAARRRLGLSEDVWASGEVGLGWLRGECCCRHFSALNPGVCTQTPVQAHIICIYEVPSTPNCLHCAAAGLECVCVCVCVFTHALCRH